MKVYRLFRLKKHGELLEGSSVQCKTAVIDGFGEGEEQVVQVKKTKMMEELGIVEEEDSNESFLESDSYSNSEECQ